MLECDWAFDVYPSKTRVRMIVILIHTNDVETVFSVEWQLHTVWGAHIHTTITHLLILHFRSVTFFLKHLNIKRQAHLPRGSKWIAGRRWQFPHYQKSLRQSGRYIQGQWRWSRPPADLRPGSKAPVSAGRWRWRSDRWTPVPERHTHHGCAQ